MTQNQILILFFLFNTLAAIYAIVDRISSHLNSERNQNIQGQKDENRKIGSRKRLVIDGIVFVPVLVGIIWLTNGNFKEIWTPPIPIAPVELIDIGGSYYGYVTDDLGSKTKTYMIIELQNDTIKCTFKNDRTVIKTLKYNFENRSIEFDDKEHGEVVQQDDKIIIKDISNPVRWEFSKRLD